jgi:hypothetical protein
MSCGRFRAVVNNTSFALHDYCGTKQLHPFVRRDLARWQSLKVWQCLPECCGCSAPEPDGVILRVSFCVLCLAFCKWAKLQSFVSRTKAEVGGDISKTIGAMLKPAGSCGVYG